MVDLSRYYILKGGAERVLEVGDGVGISWLGVCWGRMGRCTAWLGWWVCPWVLSGLLGILDAWLGCNSPRVSLFRRLGIGTLGWSSNTCLGLGGQSGTLSLVGEWSEAGTAAWVVGWSRSGNTAWVVEWSLGGFSLGSCSFAGLIVTFSLVFCSLFFYHSDLFYSCHSCPIILPFLFILLPLFLFSCPLVCIFINTLCYPPGHFPSIFQHSLLDDLVSFFLFMSQNLFLV